MPAERGGSEARWLVGEDQERELEGFGEADNVLRLPRNEDTIMGRKLSLLLTCAAGLVSAAFPASPLAATAGTDDDSFGYAAGVGEANQVELTMEAGGVVVRIHDTGAVIVVEGDCISVDPHTATCPRGFGGSVHLGGLADTFTLTSSNFGAPGELYVTGGAGSDTLSSCPSCVGLLDGRAGDDTLTGKSLYGGRGHDVLRGTGGIDFLVGGSGNDLITAGGRSDLITAGPGSDVIRAGPGADDLYGGGAGGNDFLYGGQGSDRLFGQGGHGLLRGQEGNDKLFGGLGPDLLFAGPGDDFIRSRDGRRDRVRGQRGNDRARVDQGLDSVRGVEKLL